MLISAPLASGNAMAARMEALRDILSLIEKNSWEALIEKVMQDPSLAFSPLSGASSWSSGSQGNLALHEVCKQQPTVAVIEAVMQAYPDAVRTRGQWGYLPLHYACASGASHNVIVNLINAYPAGTRTRDNHEEILPLHLACKWGASEAVVLAILTIHPESVYIRDAQGKTPQDHAFKLPTASIQQPVMDALKLGPLLCAVSKATQQRDAQTAESRLKILAEEHASLIKRALDESKEEMVNALEKLELQNKQERLEANKVEQDLQAQLDAAHAQLATVQAQLEASHNEMAEATSALNSTTAELTFTIESKTGVLAELGVANIDRQTMRDRIAEVEGQLASQTQTLVELQACVEMHEEAEKALSLKVVYLTEAQTESEEQLALAKSARDMVRRENESLGKQLAKVVARAEIVTARLATVQKWAQSLSFSMDTWSIENECTKNDYVLNSFMDTRMSMEENSAEIRSTKSSGTIDTDDDMSSVSRGDEKSE